MSHLQPRHVASGASLSCEGCAGRAGRDARNNGRCRQLCKAGPHSWTCAHRWKKRFAHARLETYSSLYPVTGLGSRVFCWHRTDRLWFRTTSETGAHRCKTRLGQAIVGTYTSGALTRIRDSNFHTASLLLTAKASCGATQLSICATTTATATPMGARQ